MTTVHVLGCPQDHPIAGSRCPPIVRTERGLSASIEGPRGSKCARCNESISTGDDVLRVYGPLTWWAICSRCEPAQEASAAAEKPSTDTPRPWTDAHQREAFARLCELAAELWRTRSPSPAASLTAAVNQYHGTDAGFRQILVDIDACFGGVCNPARIEREVAIVRQRAEQPAQTFGQNDPRPIDMILHCPLCAVQHVDAPEPEKGWANPPHRSHLCHACRCVWRPADVATNGVAALATVGSADTWTPADQDSAAWRMSRLQTAARAPRIVPCVAALVTDSTGRLLLVCTPRGWELPGGRMEPGETWRDAIFREVREETGLEFARCADRPRVLDGLPVNGAKYQSVIIVARGTAKGEPIPADGDAVREARWFARGELPADLSPIATAELVREWAAEPAAAPSVIVGRYPTVDEVRAHAAAHPCGEGMGAWLASFLGPRPHRPVIVTLGAVSMWIGAYGSMRDVVLVNDVGNAIEDDFDTDTTWRPLTAEGLPILVGGDAEQRGDDLAHASPIWTPPPGVAVEVLHGSIDGPLLVALVTLDPGAEVPREMHEDRTESIVALTGELRVTSGRQARMRQIRGACITVAAGCEHTISNVSTTEPATYISIMRRVEA